VLLSVCGAVAAADRMDDGREAYEAACARCHDTGAGGAPVTRREEDWKNRSHLWDAVLFKHAEEGYLGMPARGGDSRLSDYDVDAAAEYMLTITHPDLPRD
jgi:cytochrome c5